MSNKKVSQIAKTIYLGKFHFIHDGSKTGHPGYIIWKDDENNLYLAIKFGSTGNVHNFPLGRPVGSGVKKSYVYKRAFLGKRKDYSKTVISDMFLTKNEVFLLENKVDFSKPVFSSNINRKDKRSFKRFMSNKKSPFQGQLSGYETRK